MGLEITLTVLQGSDRGKVFRCLVPPVTIGREEGNSIQLNDERISRCHLKIQEDNSRLVLTDLESTNGTKVNGQECHLRNLKHGDLISVGRSVLLVGTQEEIAMRLAAMKKPEQGGTGSVNAGSSPLDFDFSDRPTAATLAMTLGMIEPPELPSKLSPSQAAQLCEVLDYVHQRLQKLADSAEIEEGSDEVRLSLSAWQRLLDVQSQLAIMIRQVSDPE